MESITLWINPYYKQVRTKLESPVSGKSTGQKEGMLSQPASECRSPISKGQKEVGVNQPQNEYTSKAVYRKFETIIPRNETSRLQSQFLHSCFCDRFIYSHDRSAYSAAGDRSWEYINRSQKYECGSWDWGRAVSFLGVHKSDFLCSVCQPPKGFISQPTPGLIPEVEVFTEISVIPDMHFIDCLHSEQPVTHVWVDT